MSFVHAEGSLTFQLPLDMVGYTDENPILNHEQGARLVIWPRSREILRDWA